MTRWPDHPIRVLETWHFTFYTDSFPPHNISLAPDTTRGGFMHRCGTGCLLILAIAFALALTGCLGKSTSNPNNGGVQSVTLNPGNIISVSVGTTQAFSASARNALGGAVLGINIQFVVTSGTPGAPAPLSINSGGNACAGTWDSTGTMCSPGTPGIAYVTAVAEGKSSPATTVYVHQHIDSIQISRIDSGGPPPLYDCFYQGQTWLFGATAYSNGLDITNTVGPVNWAFSNTGVVTALPYTSPGQPNVLNQAKTTAKSPGITQLFATVSGTTSAPYPYTTCLVSYLRLQLNGSQENSITVNNGGSVPIVAIAVDTVGTVLTAPPLTWSTTNPEVAAFSSVTNTTGTNNAAARANLGGATLTASCSPPSCNIGVLPGLPIYASDGLLPNGTNGFGSISAAVISTSAVPTYTAWAATTGCQDAPGCASALFSVTPTTASGKNPIGVIVSLPRTPNSMMFNHVSSPRVYFGADQGLMFVDVTASSPSASLISQSSTPCNVSLCGKVLTISNDGKLVVVSDTVSTPSQVYIYNAGSTGTAPVDLVLSGTGERATTAAFSPDQLKLFILTNLGNLYVYSTVDALTLAPVATSATDVQFSADGSFAYVSGNPVPGTTISAFATCDNQPTHATSGSDFVTTPGIPSQIFPSPDGQHVLALDPANGSVDIFTTTQGRNPLPDGQFVCDATPPPPLKFADIDPAVNFPQTAQSIDLGQGKNLTPIFAQLVADGSKMIIVAQNIPAVLVFNVSNGSTTSFGLSRPGFGSSFPLSASASTDGSQVYVATCDQYPNNDPTQPCSAGSVHIVDTISQGDFQQVPYVNMNDNNNTNMCSNGQSGPICLPNLIAIRPQ
jgi:hypothetical protein